MKKALFVDCCIREESRTKKLADSFFDELKGYDIKHLVLENEDLKPLNKESLESRQKLLDKNEIDNSRFNYAREFADADLIIIAAPFWDLSFPALLKIYIENISVEGITFNSTDKGLIGLAKANTLVYLTTRGGIYQENDELELAIPHLRGLCRFFGIKEFKYISADGMDIFGYDSNSALEQAKQNARELARGL